MTPREPDRYDKAALEIWGGDFTPAGFAAALRREHDAALDEAADAILAEEGHRARRVLPALGPHGCVDLVRALKSPAAAPAAETCPEPPPGWETITTGPTAGCGNIATYRDPAPPPRAEAREPVNCWIQLRNAEKRIEQMEAAIRWACGEATLPDGRWFDPQTFGHAGSIPRYWWRSVLRLYSGVAARAATPWEPPGAGEGT